MSECLLESLTLKQLYITISYTWVKAKVKNDELVTTRHFNVIYMPLEKLHVALVPVTTLHFKITYKMARIIWRTSAPVTTLHFKITYKPTASVAVMLAPVTTLHFKITYKQTIKLWQVTTL